ncbi:uncharacterized protein CDAR_110421 [Caerostris darwini]|uniref:Uncharacterized protein n=1 Tax=Caerostris darwini TaxID=1538125 RepID=A0AAV4M4S7_9ARAC|nr:uncharacterized protein CDAR_110421 [Caerostris darwini]
MFQALFYFISYNIVSLFVVYYSLTCTLLQDLYDNLLDQLNNDNLSEEMEKLLEVNELMTTTIRNIDECFSFQAFVATLLNLVGLFWTGYRIAFLTSNLDHSFLLICPFVYLLSHHLLLLISASKTNEKAAKAKLITQCLLRNCRLETRRRIKYEKNIALESNLTAWKIYVFDRSLIITSFGCLLTYGILLATLGRD